jgi:hypothetical protein
MFIVQFYSTVTKGWERSGNMQSKGVYATAEAAQGIADQEDRLTPGSEFALRYRIAPLPPTPAVPDPDPELVSLREKFAELRDAANKLDSLLYS